MERFVLKKIFFFFFNYINVILQCKRAINDKNTDITQAVHHKRFVFRSPENNTIEQQLTLIFPQNRESSNNY